MKMRPVEALKVLGLQGTATYEEIKLAYRKMSSKYHPDRNPAGLEMMKLVNAAFNALTDYVAGSVQDEQEASPDDYSDELNTALNAIIDLGLTIEICGCWVWVSGDTRPHREVLKASGYRWAPKKLMWSFAPSESKSTSRGKFTMDDIRARHGSATVKSKSFVRIAA